jgi:hypothetical protein
MKKALTFLILFLVSGCATQVNRQYEGPVRSEAEIAVLEHPDPLHSFFILERVDGKWRGAGLFDRYELLPGEHSITCSLHSPMRSSKYITVYFKAEAGKKYVAEAINGGSWWSMQIRDKITNQAVSYSKKQ